MKAGPAMGCATLLLLWVAYCAAIGATLSLLDWVWSLVA